MANQNNGKTPYKHKTNRGSLFENARKTKETQPDFTGSIDVNGTIFWINGWKEMTSNGKKRMSLSVQLQEERHPNQAHEDEGWGGAVPSRQPQQRQQRDSKW